MTSSQRASFLPTPFRRQIALCLCGGGVSGAMYQVGCLAALEEAVVDFRASNFDMFIAHSSGASVAVPLAGGFSALRLYRSLLNPDDDFFPLQRQHLLRLDVVDWLRAWASGLNALRHFVASAAMNLRGREGWNDLDLFWDALPAGLFSMDAYERFYQEFMERRAIPNSFASFPSTLRIVATDIDTGERTVFGRDALLGTVSSAVAASSASPLLFAPVRIANRDYIDPGAGAVAHADLATDEGAQTVIIIHPAVPFTATDPGRIRDKGLLWIYHQTWRIHAERQLRDGLRRLGEQHPDTDLILLEPSETDAALFMYSPMNFSARRAVLEYGYASTLRNLRTPHSPLAETLRKRGFEIIEPSPAR
jgi:NTE family protein